MSTTVNELSSSVAGLASLREGAALQGTLLPGTQVGGSIPPHLQYAAAQRRIDALIERHGADSDQVRAALMRWAAILETSDSSPATSQRADVAALVDAIADPPQQVISTPQWTPGPESLEAVVAGLGEPAEAVVVEISDRALSFPSVRRFPARRPVSTGGVR